MPYEQFASNELGKLFDIAIERLKKRKSLFAVCYLIIVFYLSIPSFNIPFLKLSEIRVTSLMEQRAVEHELLFYPQQSWISINKVNPNFLKAVISIEDDDFFNHKGIDWNQINKSLRINERRDKIVRGGSTITMQLAKNLYLSTSRNFFRKAKETIIALRMEKELSKKNILENYINIVEWGNGIFGIKKASQIYFHKEPSSLTLDECARLAAVIPSPLEHAPNNNSNYVLRRSSTILDRLNNVELNF